MEKIGIDVRNAVHRFQSLLDAGEGYDDAFSIISNKMDLTADEMDQLCELVPYKG